MANVICVVIAYLLGSLQTSVVLSKFFKFPDPRTQGSHNAGATNVLRTVGKNAALLTLIGDILKGVMQVEDTRGQMRDLIGKLLRDEG